MVDKIFADGLRFDNPSPKAPSYVKGRLSVNVKKFTDFLSKVSNERGWVNLDIKESRNGTLYVELNTYQAPKS